MKKLLISIMAALGFGGAQATEFPANVEMNEQTIQALIEANSNPSKLHPLEHHFFCYSPESLEALMSKGETLGYRTANLGDNEHEGTHYWYGDLIKDTPLDIKIINRENEIMLKLASEFKADYDGWGTPVVN